MDRVAYKTVRTDGSVETVMWSQIERMKTRLKLFTMSRRMTERFDRCCHGKRPLRRSR